MTKKTTVHALRYVGEGAFRPGLPARDLDRADLDGLVATTKRDIEDIVTEAEGSGLYEVDRVEEEPEERTVATISGPSDVLDDPSTSRPVLVQMAEDLGLTVASRDTKTQIADAIRAERTRIVGDPATSKATLAGIATDLGVDVRSRATKADIADALSGTAAGLPEGLTAVVTHAEETVTPPFPDANVTGAIAAEQRRLDAAGPDAPEEGTPA